MGARQHNGAVRAWHPAPVALRCKMPRQRLAQGHERGPRAQLLLLFGMKDEALLHCHPTEAENRVRPSSLCGLPGFCHLAGTHTKR